MSKAYLNIVFASLAILLFSACEKVIEIELEEAPSKLVIEANLSNRYETQVVKISRTIPFSHVNTFDPFTGAQVVLSTKEGEKIVFFEVEPGIYKSESYQGIPGRNYTIEVNAAGNTYTASSTMPREVKLDSLSLRKLSFFGNTSSFLQAHYNDPAGVQNQYRYIVRTKNKVVADLVTEDRFNDGNRISDIIFYELDELKPGERIEIEFQGIDRNVFRYLFALNQIKGEGGPPVAPDNPKSNFNNGALGFFNAHTSQKMIVVIR